MQAIIPAAGRGTRLRPLTDQTPKELLPVGGRPMIAGVLAEAAHAGFDEVTVVVSPDKPALRAIEAPIRLRFMEQPAPRGALDAVERGRFAARYAVLYPDYVQLPDQTALSRLIAAAEDEPDATWFGLIRRTPEVAARSGATLAVGAHAIGGGRYRLDLAPDADWHTTFAVVRGAEHQRRIASGPLDDARVPGILAGLAADDLLRGVDLPGTILDLGVPSGYRDACRRFAEGARWR